MIIASRVVSPVSSGLPPKPTVPSHCSSSHIRQPLSTASKAEPLSWSNMYQAEMNKMVIARSYKALYIVADNLRALYRVRYY